MSHESGKFARPTIDQTEKPPTTKVHYFYASSTSIDDPQAVVPPPTASPAPTTKFPLRPFSDYDNTALDKAWNKLRWNLLKYKEEKNTTDLKGTTLRSRASSSARHPQVVAARTLRTGIEVQRALKTGQHAWPRSPNLEEIRATHSRPSSSSGDEDVGHLDLHGASRPVSRLRESAGYSESDAEEQGLTGRPFARAPSRSNVPGLGQRQSLSIEEELQLDDEAKEATIKTQKLHEPSTHIPVGISKLHHVAMPQLQLEPIYWKPVNDIAAVIRSTWFYKDTMLPVETDVANMLERGYLDLRPWTSTWQDEINSAIKVGGIGEEKIAHNLWPEEVSGRRSSMQSTTMSSSGVLQEEEDTPESRRKHVLEAASQIIDVSTSGQDVDNKAAGSHSLAGDGQKRIYLGSQIIYVDEHEAVILRPSLAPSSYYGRRPLANYIRKGRKLGICVRRGFDQNLWSKLYPDSPPVNPSKTKAGFTGFRSDGLDNSGICSEYGLSQATGGPISDLILVIHGIGQKMAERVESFHFTHAINAVRRELNVEIGLPQVKQHLRKDMGGVMILPVNWRSELSFEDGGYKEAADGKSNNPYTLKDITPDTLPSVRSVINDVVFDIPYYLDAQFGPKMTAAVIEEANAIYHTWCKNNPGFEKYGRVHVLGHSLGSIMAVDILSRQPTVTDTASHLDRHDGEVAEHFAFDTKNLYICGSPVGFFLLLKQASLIPRENRNKPSSEGDDWAPGIAGKQGEYGCLAVDNIYNIINPYDPVAYRLNAALDVTYAASLKKAFVPSSSTSWMSLGNPFKTSTTTVTGSTRKPPLTARLPSNVELETHNFTREEIAEKRAFLLNDNGQIDYLLKYGGGALEIQYLTMLGAHSSYWMSKDFVRFLVMETGREPGREGTLEAMRAKKKRTYA